MKKLILLIACSVFFLSGRAQYDMNNPCFRSNVVRISSATCGGGSGNIIGYDSRFVYVVTAAHVVQTTDNNQDTLTCQDSISVYIPEYRISYQNRPTDTSLVKVIEISGSLVFLNSEQDFAVIKIPISTISANCYSANYLGIISFDLGRNSLTTCKELRVYIDGYASTMNMTPSRIIERIVSVDYSSNKNCFTMSAVGVQEGQSGSFVMNTNSEVIGMLLAKNQGGKESKVLKLQVIRSLLKEKNIPDNLLQNPKIIGTWALESAMIFKPSSEFRFPEGTDQLTFSNDGTVTGYSNGNFCIANNEIQIFSNINSILFAQPTGFDILVPLFSIGTDKFKMDFRSMGFNFGQDSVQDTRQPLVLENESIRLSLFKVNK